MKLSDDGTPCEALKHASLKCLVCVQVISKAVSWVLKHQTWDGAFSEVTWSPDRKMNNSLVWPNDHVKFRNISLTAHVLIMLETVKDLTGVSCRAAAWRSLKILSRPIWGDCFI